MVIADLSPTAQQLVPPDANEEMLYKMAMAHPAIFTDVFCKINDPNQGILDFRLWDWQWEILALCLKHKRIIILKARQLGVSWLLASYALWVARTRPGSNVLLVSRKEGVASELLAKCSFMYRNLPGYFHTPKDKLDRDNDTEMKFGAINSKIVALASTKGAGRSESATLVVPDEWAFHPDDIEMYGSYEPTLGTSGQIVGCSTANGRRGLFYNLYTEARREWSPQNPKAFFPIFLPWTMRPDYDEAFYESKKHTYEAAGQPELLFQEFPADENSAFGGSLRTFFPRKDLDRLAGIVMPPKKTVAYDSEGAEVDIYDLSKRGVLKIWEEARPGLRYTIGADVADVGAGGSRSAAIVINARTMQHVATLVGLWEPYTYTRLLVELGKRYNNAMLAPERNNHGISVVEGLSHLYQYPNIYRTRLKGSKEVRLGWVTNTESRNLMLDTFRMAVADESFFTQDDELVQEMYTFEEDDRGKPRAASGSRDDLPMAAAISVSAKSQYPITRRSYQTTHLTR